MTAQTSPEVAARLGCIIAYAALHQGAHACLDGCLVTAPELAQARLDLLAG